VTLLRRRAARRSCWIHGDNGCEIQGEAGRVTRALDKRRWRGEVWDATGPDLGSDGSGPVALSRTGQR
jgi:hypothetical protein